MPKFDPPSNSSKSEETMTKQEELLERIAKALELLADIKRREIERG